jgi:predicted metal-dependent hydrolase
MDKNKILKIKDINVIVYKKDIKNYHLSVLPPDGKVRVSVPRNVSDDTVRLLVIKKYQWIKKHREAFLQQERQTPREYVSGESHYFKGKRYLLRVEHAKRPQIQIKNKEYIYFYVPEHYTHEQRENYYEKWLRKELKKELNILVPKWENITGLKANEVKIKKMKTKWGSCNPRDKRIWINLELIKKPHKHLEYVILHELVHFIERKHNKQFKEIMTRYMPNWEIIRRQLNEFIL